MGLLKFFGRASDPVKDRVREMVSWAETLGVSVNGERKRHQVLNRLIEEFPSVRRRDLAFLIEQVIQES